MKSAVNGLLLDGAYRPITHTFGFLECSAEHAADVFLRWRDRTYTREGRAIRKVRVRFEGLTDAFIALLPLMTWKNRWLFLETNSPWCAYIENGYRGTDSTPIGPLADRCQCRGMRVTNTPADKATGEMHACIWEVYNSPAGDDRRTERAVWAFNDGGRWDFGTIGEPYAFEQLEQYDLPRKRDRFTHEMLNDYLHHFGIDAFNEAFYRVNSGCRGYLVYVDGPLMPGNEEHPFALPQSSP